MARLGKRIDVISIVAGCLLTPFDVILIHLSESFWDLFRSQVWIVLYYFGDFFELCWDVF